MPQRRPARRRLRTYSASRSLVQLREFFLNDYERHLKRIHVGAIVVTERDAELLLDGEHQIELRQAIPAEAVRSRTFRYRQGLVRHEIVENPYQRFPCLFHAQSSHRTITETPAPVITSDA